jgi:hypothetical protein
LHGGPKGGLNVCGIVGIVKLDSRETVDEARLKRMRDDLRHRGPELSWCGADGRRQRRYWRLPVGDQQRRATNRLTMIHRSLRAAIETDRTIPILTHWFESSVPGLYIVGLTSPGS